MKKAPLKSHARARILDAAITHFASVGYHGASIREITAKAGVNLASINYHFRSKESLYTEALSSALRPLNQARKERLERASALASGALIPLELIIEIFAAPLLEMAATSKNSNTLAARLIGRSMSEPLPFAQTFLASEQHSFTAGFAQEIRRHATQVSPTEFMWRLSFIVGALHHTLATMHYMDDLTRGLCRGDHAEQATAHFVRFAVNTIRAPEIRE